MCQIIIDHWYQGQMVCRNGEWRPALNRGTVLTGDDVTVLIEIIETSHENGIA